MYQVGLYATCCISVFLSIMTYDFYIMHAKWYFSSIQGERTGCEDTERETSERDRAAVTAGATCRRRRVPPSAAVSAQSGGSDRHVRSHRHASREAVGKQSEYN